jgi:hypothetical protein
VPPSPPPIRPEDIPDDLASCGYRASIVVADGRLRVVITLRAGDGAVPIQTVVWEAPDDSWARGMAHRLHPTLVMLCRFLNTSSDSLGLMVLAAALGNLAKLPRWWLPARMLYSHSRDAMSDVVYDIGDDRALRVREDDTAEILDPYAVTRWLEARRKEG